MKKIRSTLFLLLFAAVSLPAFAINTTYEINNKEQRNGYIIKKIWLTNYARPRVSLSALNFSPSALPAGATLARPEQFTVILGMERKRPFAVVKIPAYSAGTSQGIVDELNSCTMTVEETDQPARQTTTAAKTTDVTTSVLATGTWYKIGITKTGFYKIDYAFLKSMGLAASGITSSNIRIFGNGGNMLSEANYVPRLSDLTENAVSMNDGGDNTFNDGDYLVFYGTGPLGWQKDSINNGFSHVQNLYSDTAYYFITIDKGAGLRIAGQGSAPAGNVNVTDFNYYDVHDEDLVNPVGIGKSWYGEQFIPVAANLTQTFTFNLGASISQLSCKVSFAATGPSGNSYSLSLNGGNMGGAYFSTGTGGDQVMAETTAVYTGICNAAVANVAVTFGPSVSSSIGYLNYIEINGRRPLVMSGDQMSFRDWNSVGAGHIASYTLQGANGNTRVWDVTNPQVPVVMNGSLGGSNYSFASDARMLHEFAAYSSTNLYTPSFAGTVANQNLHGTGQVDCIIVTYKDFLPQANELADYHRKNMSVVVATTDQIYNEFSSGSQDLSAIRDFARMFYKRAGADSTKMPRYLVLFGGASYDYKNRLSNNSNFVPVFESKESTYDLNSFSTDDFYGFLDDSEDIENTNYLNALDIGIGRLPARSVNDAKALVTKITGYKTAATLGPWRIQSMLVADNNDGAGCHMCDAEDMAQAITASSKNLYNESKVYLDAIPTVQTPAGDRCPNANASINENVYRGVFVINYNGHGNTEVWADERILSQDDFNTWNNANMLPFMITATCDFGQFDHPQYVSAAEEMVLRQNGGVISVLTTTAAVYANYNNELNSKFLTGQFTQNANSLWNAFGDASRIGKNATYVSSTNGGELANFRKFSLLGDPALSPNFPEHFVYLDSLMDDATHLRTDTINALGAYTASGSVHDKNGTLLSDFNGLLSVTIYDKPRVIATITSANATFKMQDNIVYKGKVSVVNGLYQFTFIAPKDINYYFGTGKVSTYAQNATTDGAGVDTGLAVGGFSAHPVLSTVPPIVKPYINDTLFLNGGITGSNTSLYVSIYSETGINVTGNKLGHDLTGVLDGNIESPYTLNDYYETEPNTYQRGFISFPIAGLADGKHNIKVKAWDVNNNSGEGSVDFIVLDGTVVGIQNLMNYPNPFSNLTHFVFEHNHPEEELNVKINIYNTAGSLVKNIEQVFTPTGSRSNEITWDGTDNNGERLPSGMYVYRTLITTEKGFKSTAYQKLVIVR
jgi:hypothetical protein